MKLTFLSDTVSSASRIAMKRGLAILCAVLCLSNAATFGIDNIWTRGAGNFDWNEDGNWDQGGVPQADPFEEEGVIENGDTVFLDSIPLEPAGILLGRAAGTFGGLEIRSGGSIDAIDSTGAPNGTVSVGVNGEGYLEIQPGGSLTSEFFNVNGQSNFVIGGTGAGVANLGVVNGVNLNGTTRIIGAEHTISAANFTLGGGGTFISEITSANHSPLSTTGAVTLNGDYALQFSGGITPMSGDTWNLVDAGAITGEFDNLDFSAAPTPGPGEQYRLSILSGGDNGQVLQLGLSSVLTLSVDWNSRSISFSSPSGQVIDIEGYSILSDSGALDVDQWNSLSNQGTPNWDEATPTSMALSELNPEPGDSLSVGVSAQELGTPFAPIIGEFGTPPEDLVFEYTTAGGEIIQGVVDYTGNRVFNNLLLTVDPTTGQGQLKNSSETTISLEGYSVLSESASLLPEDGDWLSLADQGITNWEEATPMGDALSELLPEGTMTMTPGQSFDVGHLFDEFGGSTDLVLEFLVEGEAGGQFGVVHYGPIAAAVDGDYNGNGVVDAADYAFWLASLGQTGSGLAADGNGDNIVDHDDYVYWKQRFGNTFGAGSATGQVAAVPEPASLAILIGCVSGMVTCGSRFRDHLK